MSSTSGLSFTLCELRVHSGHFGVEKRFISYFTAAKGGISSSVLRLMRAMTDNETQKNGTSRPFAVACMWLFRACQGWDELTVTAYF